MARFKVGDVIIRIPDGELRQVIGVKDGYYIFYKILSKEKVLFDMKIAYTENSYKLHERKVKDTKIARLIHNNRIIKEENGYLHIKGE